MKVLERKLVYRLALFGLLGLITQKKKPYNLGLKGGLLELLCERTIFGTEDCGIPKGMIGGRKGEGIRLEFGYNYSDPS